MRVVFLHPRGSGTFPAEVDDTTEGRQCIENLIKEAFLDTEPEERPYTLTLARTRKEILRNMTMKEAGVKDNDTIEVDQREKGAQ